MDLSINNWIHFNNSSATKDGDVILQDEYAGVKEPQELYRLMSFSYMKFFKMDMLCKWAWLGAETLLTKEGGHVYDGIDKNKIAVVLLTQNGCIDVDKKYKATMSDIPSPALFVYTLPNIMLGEICIRHGFKGEQLCLVSDGFNAEELHFWVNDLLRNRGMEACICGFADGYDNNKDVCLFWITKQDGNTPFTKEKLNELYNQ
ncbi:MAG: hypothetical protein KDC07_01350 [Chitinophagaceae bacterium]|nr:hypothetical protein [Chitinophagaceae bacterium]MCB9047732.1 3-oxoacyl-ACP synthase [Chitinophagales bacterium]